MGVFRLLMLSALVLGSTQSLAAVEQDATPSRDSKLAEFCAVFKDHKARARMDGLRRKIHHLCSSETGFRHPNIENAGAHHSNGSRNHAQGPKSTLSQPDTGVNDAASDVGSFSHTQNESALAVNQLNGTICTGFNDSYHYFAGNDGAIGFSRSTDGGATFDDRGALAAGTWGDPSLVWRRSDENFYFLSLVTNGLGLWRSTNDCLGFQWLPNVTDSFGADRPMMAVDNTPTSPNYGRLYVAWTEFDPNGTIVVSHSDDGLNWSDPEELSESGEEVQAAWPAVSSDGTLYVAWLRWPTTDTVSIEIARSDNGGLSFADVTNPMSNRTVPQDADATDICAQPALKGNIRHIPAPQIAVDDPGTLHAVYAYDPDQANIGDVVNVYYRRSTNRGASWHPEVLLNDDQGTNDQFFPALSAGSDGTISASWYDRRLDPTNLMLDYYLRISLDGGASWQPSERLSDVSSPIAADPDLTLCYRGDYDQQAQHAGSVLVLWADDRNIQGGDYNADVWFEKSAAGMLFADGFESGDLSAWDS